MRIEIKIFQKGFWVSEGSCQSRYCVGEAIYKNEVNKTGWAMLQLETRDTHSDIIQVIQIIENIDI